MKPKLVHQEAMDYSFKAKQALDLGNHTEAFDFYKKAADLESQVAEFYFDKPDLEPTRSIIIRSAAFLNLKAGLIDNAQKFIFFGLLHTTDESIKKQLNDALEISVSLKNIPPDFANAEYNYLTLLRQRSVHYVIEPSDLAFEHSVSLEMVKDFSENFLKSLKAYAVSQFKRTVEIKGEIEETIVRQIEKHINPLLTNFAYGSFKFSIANDFLPREGEKKELVELKSNVVSKYHSEIFINPLTDSDIEDIKRKFNEDEVNDIFRPLAKLKSNSSPYKVGYYDVETFRKVYLSRIINKQKKKLLAVAQITHDDIGLLENYIVHKRSVKTGKIVTKTILKEEFKSYETGIKINQIEPFDSEPILLSEEIYISMNFNSNKGFTFSFDDFRVEFTDIEHEKSLKGFHKVFYDKLISLANKKELNEQEQKDWDSVRKLIGNSETLKR